MGRDKRNENSGQYVNVPYQIIKSAAWRSLGGSSVKLFFELHARFNGGNNGKIRLSFAEAAHALGMGKATVQRAFQDLQGKGFLVLERKGSWYGRQAHEWRLTTKPMQGPKGKTPATNDWHFWKPPKTKGGSKSEPSGSSVVPFQNLRPASRSVLEPVRAKTICTVGFKSEH